MKIDKNNSDANAREVKNLDPNRLLLLTTMG